MPNSPVRTTTVGATVANYVERPRARTTSIQEIRVGMRTMGKNPLREQVAVNGSEPNPETWRHLVLRMTKESGRRLDINLLRELIWIQAVGAVEGGSFFLDLPEMGAVGEAFVISIGPCPEIMPGPGNVVTGTFHHEADPDTRILSVTFANGAYLKGVTDNHPFYSVDKGEFVPVGEMREGESVKVNDGVTRIAKIESRFARPGEMLYNLETHGEHVYQVTSSGILVHNSCVNDVLNESAGALGDITSRFRLSENEALEAGLKWLGRGYREIGRPGSGVFVSADDLRRFRIDPNSLLGRHTPSVPQVHFEWLENALDRFSTGNNHVPIY